MNDTPQHIKELLLKIWLSKSPGDRLNQFMEDNNSLFYFGIRLKKQIVKRLSLKLIPNQLISHGRHRDS